MTANSVTLNVFDKKGRLIVVCFCRTEEAARKAFQGSRHHQKGNECFIYGDEGEVLYQWKVGP